ncbi:MAG TPA: prolyl oligopeptidase family serine peptidase [Polyangia bacterium]|jgi:prolyl oligopeptidase
MSRAAAPTVPASRKDALVETLHGEAIADPYRWLEDETAPEVKAWTAAQTAYTRLALDALPGRVALEKRFWELYEIGSLGTPVPRPHGPARQRAWRYFYTRRDGKQNQPVLYARDGRDGTDRILVDVNALAADGTRSLDWWVPSEDGALVAYGVSADGSEESVLRVRDAVTGADLPDAIDRTRACSLAWLPDGRGFYYTRYPAPGTVPADEEKYHRHVFLHRLGDDAAHDTLVFGAGRDLKDWPSVMLSPGGRFLGIEISQGWSKSEVYLIDRQRPRPGKEPAPPIPLAVGEEALFDLAELTDDAAYLRTNAGAPRYRLVRVPLGTRTPSGRSGWRELIPEGPHPLEQVTRVGDHWAAQFLEDAASRVRLYDREGHPTSELPLPSLGTVVGMSGHPKGDELFVGFTSFSAPTTVLRQALPSAPRRSASTPPTVWRAIATPVAADAFTVTREQATSKDGTTVPLFVVHRRGLIRDAKTPTVLYGYGGFNVNMTPGWAPSIVPFLERGGVYVLAVLRGGGEYGEAWHQAGMGARKQNVFDDFIAAATHLIDTHVTSPARLAIMGRSNGGLLVGAALTQRPDLFRAVICGVPLLDMLRYHRFRIARLWIPEYGSADDDDAFRWLRAYSPYHNVHDGTAYPAVMFSTAASDTRVDPLHARKMTARLQAATSARRPVLLRLETHAGHGMGKPLGKVIDQLVDEWSFLDAALDGT